ncbi:hypothetical protein GS501_05785 [Saccharibacter sp. 17.LH.SD]|uniref:DedA family protein n=1 Tax=Saccharibacter sp. 17.LH.SD TaxID=2689393 RepID=UPI001367BF26|nr:hypothetical protein [Saccharibacter sp. 17.LH.SD]
MIHIGSILTAQPVWLKIVSIVVGTFILEDVATVLSAVATQAGRVSFSVALCSLYFGVVVGDIGLYALGFAAARWPFLRRFITLPNHEQTERWFSSNTIKVVGIARFIPGARLPLYTACGFFKAPFLPFAMTAIVATLVWITLLFLLSLRIGKWLLAHQGGWRWAGIAGFVLCIIFIGRFVARLQRVS